MTEDNNEYKILNSPGNGSQPSQNLVVGSTTTSPAGALPPYDSPNNSERIFPPGPAAEKNKGAEFKGVEAPGAGEGMRPARDKDDKQCIVCPPAEFFYPSIGWTIPSQNCTLFKFGKNKNYMDAYGPQPKTAVSNGLFNAVPQNVPLLQFNAKINIGNFHVPFSSNRSRQTNLEQLNTNPMLTRQKRLYIKANASNDFIFGDPYNYGDPRALLKTGGSVYVNSATALGTDISTNPQTKVVALIASEDYTLIARWTNCAWRGVILNAILPRFVRKHNKGINYEPYRTVLGKMFSHIFLLYQTEAVKFQNWLRDPRKPTDVGMFDTTGEPIMPRQTPEQKIEDALHNTRNINIAPKAAMPHFAAVPITNNQLVYGPWTNYPNKKLAQIFPYLDNDAKRLMALENMYTNTIVKYDPSLVPWNFGSMHVLDKYVDAIIEDETNYQQSIETGQLTLPGAPIFSLGDTMVWGGSSLYNYNITSNLNGRSIAVVRHSPGWYDLGPSNAGGSPITNMSVQITEGKTETTYTLRTYSSKLSLYNKENGERLRQLAKNNIEIRKDFSRLSKQLEARQKKFEDLTLNNTFRDLLYRHQMRKSSATSPTEVLVGSFYGFGNTVMNKLKPIDDAAAFNQSKVNNGPKDMNLQMHRSRVGLYEPKEMGRELEDGYSTKSFMSLDGIFSPVSFYPTPMGSTISFVKYDRRACPICDGSGKITRNNIKLGCHYCEDKTKKNLSSVGSKESLPPFILASGEKLAVRLPTNEAGELLLYSYVSDKKVVKNPKSFTREMSNKGVNLYGLNPIISATGEFRNTCAPSGDWSGHSIDIVGRGLIPPNNSMRIAENICSSEIVTYNSSKLITFNSETGQFENPMFTGGYIAKDFNDVDLNFRRFSQNTRTGELGSQDYEIMNQRFFGLRGPLVMHAWGYDVEGYPVPNASGEPYKLDSYGRPLMTRDLSVHGSHDPDDKDWGDILIGKNMVWDETNKKWSPPYRESTFASQWGQNPDTWPAGPIDLRWDTERKVWTAPQPYKHVYVVLEEDMVLEQNSRATYPARGFIDDIEYSKDKLPKGLRRVVFVKDSSGYTAPRGARLYCKYNSDSGLYDPVGKPNIVASGILRGGNDAQIYTAYVNANNSTVQDVMKVTVKFANNINLEVKPNHMAFFVYLEGSWNLMSVGGSI